MADPLLSIEVSIGGAEPSRNEFILVMLNGIEGISIPSSYDVTLFRSGDKPDINPKEIVNTVATIGINKLDNNNFALFTRTGVFEHFEKAGFGTKNDDFRVYTGRIVSPFKMLDREVVFRVFENMDVVSILEAVLKNVPHLKLDVSLLQRNAAAFKKMEYCVQFGESTLAFASRLMNRFGIHYYFDTLSGPNGPQNELMVLGESRTLNLNCDQHVVDIVSDDNLKDRTNAVAGFVQRFDPVYRSTKIGNFNILAPTKPFTATRIIDPGFDLSGATSGPAHDFKLEEFPTPFATPEQAKAHAARMQKQEEIKVATIAGRAKNRTFTAGRNIFINKDFIHGGANSDGSLEGKTFLLTWISFSAIEPNAGRTQFWSNVGEFFKELFHGASAVNVTNGIVVGALNNYLQNQQQTAWDRALNTRQEPAAAIPFFPFVFAGGIGAVANTLGGVIAAITSVMKLNKAIFDTTFVAAAAPDNVPLANPPQGVKPLAHGPHLATVIGKNGVDTSAGDISADALGRVRVRFPWDPGPPLGDDPFVVGDAHATGRNTCWVRVAQSWAGRGHGAQYLPRIGNEVIVEFIDGDPERPIITGSVYNADRGVPNLPFPAFKDGAKPFAADDLFTHSELSTFERSGIKTSTTPIASGKRGFHVLRFDDTRGSEQLVVRSQGRYDLTAFHHHYETTHGNRHVLVKAGQDEKGNKFGGGSFFTVGGEYDQHVAAERYEAVDKAAQLAVKGDAAFDLQANAGSIVGRTATLNATKVIIEAQAKITLKVGGSYIVIDPCGVSIHGPLVKINSGGSPDSAADLELVDPADATQADPGEPDNFLELQPKGGGGGGRRKRTVKAKHGLVCSANSDGTIQVTKSIKVDAKDPAYAEAVIADLSTIAATQNGKALLDDLDGSGKSVTIRKQDPPPNPANAFATPTNGSAAGNGTGSDSSLDYNPDQWPDPSTRTKAPGDVILFHELQHADHNARGVQDNTPRADNFDDQEEFNTIGPENRYRDERGVPRRNDHHDL